MSVEITWNHINPHASEGFKNLLGNLNYTWRVPWNLRQFQWTSWSNCWQRMAKGLFSIIFKQRQWKITIHVHLSIRQVRVKENTTTSKWIWFHISRNPQISVPRTAAGWTYLLPSFQFWWSVFRCYSSSGGRKEFAGWMITIFLC